VREFATSKDGVQIPLNIIRCKGAKRDGSHPTILYGYGGYGITLSPVFNIRRHVWLDQGGVYVTANLRGGGEYGEEWHKLTRAIILTCVVARVSRLRISKLKRRTGL